MKTKILLGGALLLLSTSYIADAATVWTTCGKGVTTVGQEFFRTMLEWYRWLGDINEHYCGTRVYNRIDEPNLDETYILRSSSAIATDEEDKITSIDATPPSSNSSSSEGSTGSSSQTSTTQTSTEIPEP